MTSSKPNLDYDAMIVGGGPAGISTWLHLQKYAPDIASRTVLIEKEKYPRDKLCGGGVGGWSETVLKKLHVNIDVPSINVDTLECQYHEDIVRIHQPNFFRIVQRIEFDHAFSKIAIDRGLELHQAESFIDYNRDGNNLVVKTSKKTYKVKAVIGADGSLSQVRRKIQHSSHAASTVEIFEPLHQSYDKEYDEKKVLMNFSLLDKGLHGYIWHFPCIKNGSPYMNHGVVHFHFHKPNPLNLQQILYQDLQKRHISFNSHLLSGFPIRWLSKEDKIASSNVLLAGDAAGIDPVIGGGIHLSLSYGEIASNELIQATNTDDFSFQQYKDHVFSHLVGKYITKLNHIAKEIYIKKTNPLPLLNEIFNKR